LRRFLAKRANKPRAKMTILRVMVAHSRLRIG